MRLDGNMKYHYFLQLLLFYYFVNIFLGKAVRTYTESERWRDHIESERWRDEGEAIAYTHVHMPFERHARAIPVRHLTVERRPAENWARENEDVS